MTSDKNRSRFNFDGAGVASSNAPNNLMSNVAREKKKKFNLQSSMRDDGESFRVGRLHAISSLFFYIAMFALREFGDEINRRCADCSTVLCQREVPYF